MAGKARNTSTAPRCEFTGCTQPVRWRCLKLWGKGGTILTCSDHKPGISVERGRGKPPTRPFYQCEPCTGDTTDDARPDRR